MFRVETVSTHATQKSAGGVHPIVAMEIDADRLARDLAGRLNELEGEGFEIVSVEPVMSSLTQTGLHGLEAGWGWGAGYASAYMVIARK